MTIKNQNKTSKEIGKEVPIMNRRKEEIKELARECLKFKWIAEKDKNLNRLLSPCSFCFDINSTQNKCKICKVPDILCDEDGKKGLIGYLANKYGNIFLKDLSDKDYELVRRALSELTGRGELDSKTIKTIKVHIIKNQE